MTLNVLKVQERPGKIEREPHWDGTQSDVQNTRDSRSHRVGNYDRKPAIPAQITILQVAPCVGQTDVAVTSQNWD